MSDYKPILCLDFDGVIHSYTSGWQGADVIPDPPVPGALSFIVDALTRFDVHIFSSRSHQPGGIRAMRQWLTDHLEQALLLEPQKLAETMLKITFPKVKPPALVTIDDRALLFTGVFPSLDELANFQPWNKKSPVDGPGVHEVSEKLRAWYAATSDNAEKAQRAAEAIDCLRRRIIALERQARA